MPKTVGGLMFAMLLCFLCTISFGQEQQKDGRYYEREARKAYEAKDYPLFLSNMRRAAELRPNHPRLMYSLATAYSPNGQTKEAMMWLSKTAATGLVFSPGDDPNFVSIISDVEYLSVRIRFEENLSPMVKSVEAFTVHETGLILDCVA